MIRPSNFELNVLELQNRGYQVKVNKYLDENEWTKGDVLVMVQTVKNHSPAYFKALLDQKEENANKFKFEVIDHEEKS